MYWVHHVSTKQMDADTELTIKYEPSEMPAIPRISLNWLIFFIIWPFAALITALRRFREPFAKTIFWLFCTYFGFVFIYADPYGKGNADSARYAKHLIELHSEPVSFNKLVDSFYDPASGLTDIYQPFITWLVSIFTGNPHILFMVFAIIFGYFFTQNIWIFLTRIKNNVGFFLFLFVTAFALVNPIWQINGVRMYTAAQVFLYGCLIYLIEEKKKGILWAVSSILMHFSFMFPVALLFAYILLPRNLWILFLFFVAASFVKEINIKAVRELLSFMPDVFQPKIESYTSEPYVKRVLLARQEIAWHVKFADIAGRIIVYAWTLIVFLNRKKWLETHHEMFKVFTLALFIGGFAQIASLIPSGGRFISVAYSLFYATFILFLVDIRTNKLISLIKVFSVPLLLFSIIFKIRVGFDYTGALTFFGNPFFALFIDDQTRIIDFVKQIF